MSISEEYSESLNTLLNLQKNLQKNIKNNEDPTDISKKIQKNIYELVTLLQNKDSKITELNLVITHQADVINKQIFELQTLYSEIVKFQFYKPHPKDTYAINFGHSKYRGWTYRQIISSRDGKNLCKWVLTKSTVDTEPIKEFKRYLREVNYNL